MESISGVILAGGQGRRMGGTDKGLKLLGGKSMVERALERFAPQVQEVLINANQNLDQYKRFGYPVIPDQVGGFAGPLAGLHCALGAASNDLVATAPCDSPFLPLDLVSRLYQSLQQNSARIAVAKTLDQAHPVFCLCRTEVLPHLTAFLNSGGRKIDAWYATLNLVEVHFDDQIDAFSNINTPQELQSFENTLENDRSA